MVTETKLRNEKETPMIDYNSAVTELVRISQEKKDNLDHQIVLANSQLTELRNRHIRLEQEFSQNQRQEAQKFQNEMSKNQNQFIEKQHKLDILVRDMQRRSADLKVQEERALKAQETLVKLNDERVEIEKTRVRAHDLMQEASLSMGQAMSKAATVNSMAAENEKKAKEIDQKVISNTNAMESATVQANRMEKERVELEKLREYVDPKIREIAEMQKHVEEAKAETVRQNQEITNKIEEEKVLMKALEDKKVKLDKLEVTLKSIENEQKRKAILMETK